MGETSKIQWTHATFNPWRGCARVSPGCERCYAETLAKRNPEVLGTWGPSGVRAPASEAYWRQPQRWNREAEAAGERRRVFCASLADVFEGRRDLDPARARLWATIVLCPSLDWLLLTKRPENVLELVPEAWRDGFPPNVWIGTTIEDGRRAELRHRHLVQIPARIRFVSAEPLIGPLDALPLEGVSWAIAGGESGAGARPMDPAWARDLRDRCAAEGVAFFFKQMGASWPGNVPGDQKGGELESIPADLRIREVPPLERA